VDIPSNKEKEEASAPTLPPRETEDKYSSGNADESSEDLEIVPVRGDASACSVRPLGSPQLPRSANTLIAVGLDSAYAKRKHLDLNQAFEPAFSVDAAKHSSELLEPKLFKQAMAGPDSDKWYEACMAEMQVHFENGTWELVQLPAGRKAIGSKWVFKIKRNADGSVDCYKACLVAQGFSQRPGVDFVSASLLP
jgi:hypothetical protein